MDELQEMREQLAALKEKLNKQELGRCTARQNRRVGIARRINRNSER